MSVTIRTERVGSFSVFSEDGREFVITQFHDVMHVRYLDGTAPPPQVSAMRFRCGTLHVNKEADGTFVILEPSSLPAGTRARRS